MKNLYRKKSCLPVLFIIGLIIISYHASANTGMTEDIEIINDYQYDDDCIFDTSSYKFTTEAILNFDKGLKIRWDNETKIATTTLKNGDELYLSIGGCYHFGYNARLITNTNFSDNDLLLEKAKWIAVSFFTNGFDTGYDECIKDGLYERDQENSNGDERFYYIINPEPENEIQVFTGFSFKRMGEKTEIEIGGYFN